MTVRTLPPSHFLFQIPDAFRHEASPQTAAPIFSSSEFPTTTTSARDGDDAIAGFPPHRPEFRPPKVTCSDESGAIEVVTPSNAALRALAAANPPPPAWFTSEDAPPFSVEQ